MTKLRILLAVGLALLPAKAFADQCAVDLDKEAVWFDLLMNADQGEVIVFCEPCNQTEPQRISIWDFEEREQHGEQRLLYPDTEGGQVVLDLAYVYIPTVREVAYNDEGFSETVEVFYNLGLLTDCGATGVSPALRFVDGAFQGPSVAPPPSEDEPASPETPTP